MAEEKSSAPPDFQKAISVVEDWIKARIEELQSEHADTETAAAGGE